MSDSLHPGGLQVFPVLHYVLEFAESHVHWIGDAIHLVLCCPLLLPSSFPASGSFPMNQLFTSDGQNIGASASASVLAMNIWGWFPLGLTGLISLVFKGLSGVFSSTTIQKHQFFRRNTYWIANKAIPIVKKSIRKHSRKLKPSHSIVSRVFWEFKIV